MSIEPVRDGRAPFGDILAVLGGALVAGAVFLPYWKVIPASSPRAEGKGDVIILGAGLLAFLVGMLRPSLKARKGRVATAILIVLAALTGTLFSTQYLLSDDAILSLAAQAYQDDEDFDIGLPASEIEDRLEALNEQGAVDIERGIGPYLALGGSLVALVGGILGLRGGPREPPEPSESRGTGFDEEPSSTPADPEGEATDSPPPPRAGPSPGSGSDGSPPP